MSSDDAEDLKRLLSNAALGAAIWAFASVAVGAIGSAASTTDGVVWYGLAFVAGVFAIIGFLAGVGAVGNAWKVATLAWRHSDRWRTVLATGLVVLGVVAILAGVLWLAFPPGWPTGPAEVGEHREAYDRHLERAAAADDPEVVERHVEAAQESQRRADAAVVAATASHVVPGLVGIGFGLVSLLWGREGLQSAPGGSRGETDAA